jgi:predicted Zn-dependent protease
MCFCHPGDICLSRRSMMGVGLGAIAFVATGCSTNPETGSNQLILIDDASLTQQSLAAWQDIKTKTPVSKDAALNARLNAVARRIVNATGRGQEPWEFVVFDSPALNAFVLPGGKVGCYRGLMELANFDDELGFVLGHEVGHVSARHAAERYSRAALAEVGVQIAGSALGNSSSAAARQAGGLLGVGVQYGLILPFSRDQETQADRLGVDYMVKAGYDPRASLGVWTKMAAAEKTRTPEWLSTHPLPEERIQNLKNYINQKGYARV